MLLVWLQHVECTNKINENYHDEEIYAINLKCHDRSILFHIQYPIFENNLQVNLILKQSARLKKKPTLFSKIKTWEKSIIEKDIIEQEFLFVKYIYKYQFLFNFVSRWGSGLSNIHTMQFIHYFSCINFLFLTPGLHDFSPITKP